MSLLVQGELMLSEKIKKEGKKIKKEHKRKSIIHDFFLAFQDLI